MVERYHLVLAAVSVVAGLLAAALAVAPSRWISRRALGLSAVAAAVLGGAVLGVGAGPVPVAWIVSAVVAAAVGDPGRPEHPLGRWVSALAVVSLVGVWSAVPDTEPALAAIGALTPVALVALRRGRTVGPVGTATLLVVVLGATWTGAAGRGSVLGVGCAVGMVLVAPLVVGFGTDRWTRHGLAWVAATHVAVALVVPRVLMRRAAPDVAVLAALALIAAAGVAWRCRAPRRVAAG